MKNQKLEKEQVSLARLPGKQSQNWKRKVCREVGCTSAQLNSVAQGRENRLSKLTDLEQRKVIAIALQNIWQLYGGREDIHSSTLKECIRLVMRKFSQLGRHEILEAFRMQATGELGENKGGEMYYGELNARTLGKVLSKYVELRKRIETQIILQTQLEKEQQQRQSEAERKKEAFEVYFAEEIKKARQNGLKWQDIPLYWYQACLKRGYLENMSLDDMHAIMQEATELQQQQLNAETKKTTALKPQRLQLSFLQEENAAVKNIARRLAVERFVIQNYNIKKDD